MLQKFKQWLKAGNSPFARLIFKLIKTITNPQFPVIRPVHGLLYHLHRFITEFISNLGRILYWTPIFKTRLTNNPGNLNLYSGMPLLLGPLKITMGDNCRVSGHSTISGRGSNKTKPELVIGNNVGISWQNEIFVGNRVEIGDNVRLAVKVRIVGYPGHPVDHEARAQGLPDTDDQVGDIIIGNNAWLAAGVTVMGNVTIGEGTIVATNSVVTKDLPPHVLAGGIPAKVIKKLPSHPDNNATHRSES
ncbi:acyltransferase [Spongorhabdus nitratireducens]